ncbi:hypothetical protein EDD18DRAFT_1363318 [Armillaria luteobubalina]|uniref:Uncharacterized protein n=1 Tax=Armillaria luteobubalina TaxID=153913 RepID=A0AA39PBP4_9AGAR|nr:hypothetical protein EDD18DRAFT_1363318 [Armillaria luteobubalina]
MTTTQPAVLLDPGQAILQKIHDRIPFLPDSVDLGTPDDMLTQFSENIFPEMAGRDSDVWTYVHGALTPFFGYNMSIESVQTLICQGRYGIEGFCDWIESSIVKLGINGALLEGKLYTVLQAINGFIPVSPSFALGSDGVNKPADIDDQCEIIDIDSFKSMDVPTLISISSQTKEASPTITNGTSAGAVSLLF